MARDAILQSIRNLSSLAQETLVKDSLLPAFIARYDSLNRYIDQFEVEQKGVLGALVNLNKAEEFSEVDMEVTNVMEVLCTDIRVVAAGVCHKKFILHRLTL